MRFSISIFLFVLLFPILSFSQDTTGQQSASPTFQDSTYTVDGIIILGNTHTKDFVLIREMTLKTGSLITRQLLDYDQNRIYGLGLFNQVNIFVVPTTEQKANLIIEVSERWYIFPYPILGLKDRDWNKIYYGFGVLHSNFRGRNEKLFANFIFGYDPSVVLSYRNPFLSDHNSYMLDGRMAYNKVRNKSLMAQTNTDNFDEEHLFFQLSLGKRIGIEHTFWISAGYEIVNVSNYQPGRTISEEGKDKFPVLGLSYTYDSRDLYEYPSSGSFARLAVTKFGFPSNEIDIIRYSADLRYYAPLPSDFVFTTRAFTEITAAGRTPSYNRVFFGYGERIRGHFNEISEGENLLGLSSELHYTLMKPVYIQMPFLPPEFSILKFGIVAAAFADAGTVWFRNQPLALDVFLKGYGVGLHFLLPYSMILRTEYAFNEIRRGEFIFDVGASF